jgi:hypothetical protein
MIVRENDDRGVSLKCVNKDGPQREADAALISEMAGEVDAPESVVQVGDKKNLISRVARPYLLKQEFLRITGSPQTW